MYVKVLVGAYSGKIYWAEKEICKISNEVKYFIDTPIFEWFVEEDIKEVDINKHGGLWTTIL